MLKYRFSITLAGKNDIITKEKKNTYYVVDIYATCKEI